MSALHAGQRSFAADRPGLPSRRLMFQRRRLPTSLHWPTLIRRGCPVEWDIGEGGVDRPGLYVADCPLTNPPPEIVKQGNDAILNYFRERAVGGVDHLYEAKMLILGEGGAGKTSLLRRLYQPDQPLPDGKRDDQGHRNLPARI